MARTKVTINHAGMKELLHEAGVLARLTEAARPVLAAAQADPHDDTGDYERGLHIEPHVEAGRVTVRVVSGDWKGHILEARYGILKRALDSAR
jgi:hypothetical protein